MAADFVAIFGLGDAEFAAELKRIDSIAGIDVGRIGRVIERRLEWRADLVACGRDEHSEGTDDE